MNNLTRETIEKIEELVLAGQDIKTINVAGEEYVRLNGNESLKNLNHIDYLQALSATSIKSIVNFTKDFVKNITVSENKFIIQVKDYQTIVLYEPIDIKKHRNHIFTAQTSDIVKGFLNNYIVPEEMIINLRRTAEPNEDFEKIIKIVSGVSNRTEVQTTDDGLGQTTTLMQGNTKIAGVEIKSIASLRFKRTFSDLSYIEESFVLRLKDGKVALFTAAAEEYKRTYMDNIRDQLCVGLRE